MLKDIYNLGTVLLELMIGRFDKKRFSLSFESLPLTWSEYSESMPLIQILCECIQLDSTTFRKGKLSLIRGVLLKEYSKFFRKSYYKLSEPFVGKNVDVKNKRAIAAYMNLNDKDFKKAEEFWLEALKL